MSPSPRKRRVCARTLLRVQPALPCTDRQGLEEIGAGRRRSVYSCPPSRQPTRRCPRPTSSIHLATNRSPPDLMTPRPCPLAPAPKPTVCRPRTKTIRSQKLGSAPYTIHIPPAQPIDSEIERYSPPHSPRRVPRTLTPCFFL